MYDGGGARSRTCGNLFASRALLPELVLVHAPPLSHMEAVIIQHLLSTELALMENECARKSVPCHTANDLLWEHTRVAKIQARLCTKPGRHSRASIVCVP